MKLSTKQTAIHNLPLVFSKQYLEKQFFKRSFEWIRRHVITDEELQKEGIELEQFKRYKDFPPAVGNKIKKIITRHLA